MPETCGIAECPCNDGDPCNYEDHGETKAMPHPDRICPTCEGAGIVTPMTNAANIDNEIIDCILASERQRTSILAPFERMQQMTRRLATNLPQLTRDEVAGYVTEYAISHDILKVEVPA